MYRYDSTDPRFIPITNPIYIPISPKWNMNPNSPANIISATNDLNIVIIKDIVPFPILWNKFPATIPNGINIKKKHNILNASTIFGPKTALVSEYEKIVDSGSANMNNIAHIIIDEINPNFTP